MSSGGRASARRHLDAADGGAGTAPQGGEFVLVVDDDDLVRAGACRSLARLGYRTAAACDGEQALAMLRAGTLSVDLVFTDIRMPGAVDGIELAQIVRREFPQIAVLLTTGFAGHRTREACARILYKPYKMTDLESAVREALVAHPNQA